MKKLLTLLTTLLLTFTSCLGAISTSFAQNNEPILTAPYAILMDYKTGKVIYNKNGDQKLFPASTTKAWTAYIVIKHTPDLNKVIEIKDLPRIEGSSMYLRNGEKFTIKQLLEGLLVHSSNDVAYVLANYISGSVDKFKDLMNKEAKLIGAKNTHFNNPHGLPDNNHWTTAYDMALMAREAMSNDTFREIVKMPHVKFSPNKVYPHERYFTNTNKFLTSNEKIKYKGKDIPIKYNVVNGIKTGYTDEAGRCLLSSGVKNDMELISAVFKANGNNLYLDSRTLLDYGFDNFKKVTIVNKEDFVGEKNIFFSKQKKLSYLPESSYDVILPNNESAKDYTTKVNLDSINLPIKKGSKVGILELYKDNKLEHSINLVAKNDVNSIFEPILGNKSLMNKIKICAGIIVATIALGLFITIRKKHKEKNKYARIYSRKGKHYKRRKRR